jgi:hypothetical protein
MGWHCGVKEMFDSPALKTVVSSRLPQTLILKNISPKTALILSHLVSA